MKAGYCISDKHFFTHRFENKRTSIQEVYDELREEIEKLKTNNLTKQNNIGSCDREKLMDIASCIFNNYATSNDVDNLIVGRDTETNLKEVI
jgi:hypothetical protein